MKITVDNVEVMTSQQAAKVLDTSRRSIFRLVDKGILKSISVKGMTTVFVTADSVLEALNNKSVGKREPASVA